MKETSVHPQETQDVIMPEVNDFVAVVYDRKVYTGKVIEVDDTDANISFLANKGEISNTAVFRKPIYVDEIWMVFSNIVCILPTPSETKRKRTLQLLEEEQLTF